MGQKTPLSRLSLCHLQQNESVVIVIYAHIEC